MFDSPLNDRAPGLMKLAGWPWHGPMRIPEAFGQGSPTITLPNGGQKVLNNVLLTTVGSSSFVLPGDCFLFRDPRAVQVERTEAEQQADALRGHQWLPYVIHGSYGRLIYGRLTGADWIWHDGERNCAVRLNGLSSLNLSELRIGRSAIEGETVQLSLVGQGPSVWSGTTAFVLLDALPDGSRALLGRYQRWRQTVSDDSAWEAPCRIPLVEVWEVRIFRVDGQIRAEYERIRSSAQVVGEVTVQARPADQGLSTAYGIQWTNNGPNDWTAELVNSVGNPSIGAWSNGFIRTPFEYHEAGRLISCYYGADGQIRDVTMAIDAVDTFTHSFDHSGTVGQKATATNVTVSSVENLTPGNYAMQVSYTNATTAETTVRLFDAGVLVSTASISLTGSVSTAYTATLALSQEVNGQVIEQRGSDSSYTTSGSIAISIDGVEVYTASDTSSTGENIAAAANYSRSVSVPFIRWSPGGIFANPNLRYEIAPVRYSSQMHALMVRRIEAGQADQSYIGNTAHRGAGTPGVTQRAGAISHLYGTRNPATGQAIRDAAHPVVWI